MQCFLISKRHILAIVLATTITTGFYGVHKWSVASETKQNNVSCASTTKYKFSDLGNCEWASGAIYYLVDKEIIPSINETNFGSSLKITYQQLDKYLNTAFNTQTESSQSEELANWKQAVTKIKEHVSMSGKTLSDYQLNLGLPKKNLWNSKTEITRAEFSVLLFNALNVLNHNFQTKILGTTKVSVAFAKEWAKSKGAHQKFIDIADTYWKYGELTGIRPDLLYCQAAYETGFGNYDGKVTSDQNNWAGIKKLGVTGDHHDDHETFATPEDGVRGHFNHMSAYIGIPAIGTPHKRYVSVCKLDFAGKIQYFEEVAGRWCPNPKYYVRILEFLKEMES